VVALCRRLHTSQICLIKSDAVLFLIKNKEDMSIPVLAEIDLTRDHKKKCLLIFNKKLNIENDFGDAFAEETKRKIQDEFSKDNDYEFYYLYNKVEDTLKFITNKKQKVYVPSSEDEFFQKAMGLVLGDVVQYYQIIPQDYIINGVRNRTITSNIESSGAQYLHE
jgi:tRNA U34 5-carboxymethylaminomethyl modifying GTPase MnmE/TrmE